MREKLFQYRSYTPLPFLVIMLIFAEPTARSMMAGLGLAAVGEAIRDRGVAYAGSLTRATGGVGAPEVIVAGPFAHVRNPLYVGNILMYTGFGVMSNALFPWLPLGAIVFFAVQYHLIVSLEEEFLEKEFGAAYLEFRKHVPRFVPRLTAYVAPAQEGQRPRWSEAIRSEVRTLQAFAVVVTLLTFIFLRGR